MGGVARVGEHGRWATTRWMEGGGDGADKHRPGAVPGRGGIGGRAPGGPQGGHVGRAEAGRVPGARGRGRHDRGTGAGPGRGRAGRRCRPGPGRGGAAARRGRRRRRHGGRAAGWRPAGGALLGGGRGPARRLLPAIPRGRAGCGDGSAGAADGGGRGGLAARSALLRDTDLGALDDEELDAHITRALALLEEGFDVHFLLHGALMPILAELAFACRELLGWADEEACELLVGLSTTSTEPARRLAELAGLAARRPAVHRLLGEVDAGTAGRLAETDPEFAEAFAAYQREFARRALRYEIADPSIAELPELTLRLLADQLARGYDPVASCGGAGP